MLPLSRGSVLVPERPSRGAPPQVWGVYAEKKHFEHNREIVIRQGSDTFRQGSDTFRRESDTFRQESDWRVLRKADLRDEASHRIHSNCR